MNSPSPLVPQGAIAPKPTSRSGRVLWIALTVVVAHVGGLAVILMQGCQKDALKTAGVGADTNATPALTLPTLETNTSPYYSAASNLPPVSVAVTTSLPPAIVTPPAGMASEPPITLPTTPTTVEAGTASDYKIAKGDTLAGIAKRNKVTIGAIQAANGNLDPKRLMPGQTIKIPAPTAPTATAATPGASATMDTPRATLAPTTAMGSYKVKPGDNLTRIAKAHGITVNQLRAANGIKTTQVQAGKVLKIPAKTTAAASSNSAGAH